MSDHQFNLPWRFDGRTIYDSTGVPVAVALSYTSLRREDEDGKVFNTSDYAGEIRADAICRAMNADLMTEDQVIQAALALDIEAFGEDE